MGKFRSQMRKHGTNQKEKEKKRSYRVPWRTLEGVAGLESEREGIPNHDERRAWPSRHGRLGRHPTGWMDEPHPRHQLSDVPPSRPQKPEMKN